MAYFGYLIVLAKVLTDVTFYVPAVFSYEWSKKHLRHFNVEPPA